MTTSGTNPFSAADPALGYLYQVRLGLLWTLRRLKQGSEFLVSLETLDDVTFDTVGGRPEELLQAKHHRKGLAALTDASVDLWKSLRVWLEGHASKTILPETALHLLTTSSAPAGTAASYLRIGGRDVNAAHKLLESAALSSTSEANASAYGVFLKTSSAARARILERVTIIDGSPSILDLEAELRAEVFWAADRDCHEPFLERLEGWWMRRAIRQLSAPGARILAVELEAQMSDLREQFKQGALPIDEDILEITLDETTSATLSTSTFVRQLEIVHATKRRIAAAIRDYYRAFHQRSRWMRNELLLVGEITRYERKLVEEWELIFEGIKGDLGEDAADEAKRKAANQVLRWAETVSLPIRPNVTEPFVTRGTFHMLADKVRVGWHPEFADRIRTLLASGANQ